MKKVLSLVALVAMLGFAGCQVPVDNGKPKSTSGVSKATANVKVQSNGLTVEQDNVKKRIEAENTPGAIKHLYIVSAMSGQTLIYSTVKGKVTSSGKRLTPKTVLAANGSSGSYKQGIKVNIGGNTHRTSEVLGDDGAYGSSIPYLYWWDVKGLYHQHYVSGGQIIHVTDTPMNVKSITINMETQKAH